MKIKRPFLLIPVLFFFLFSQTGNSQCVEQFQDADNDGICDIMDRCSNFDDDLDIDKDGIPHCQDDCIDVNKNGVCDELDAEPITKKLKVHFSLKRGFYNNAIEVQLIPNKPNTLIRYTIGTNPSCPAVNAGRLYNGPILINNQEDLQTLKVIGTNGEESTKVYTHTYIFNGFNLPTVVFSCSPYSTAPGKKDTPISFEFIVPSHSLLKSVQEYAGTRTSSGGLHSGRSDKVYFRSAYGAGTLKEDLFSDFYYGPQKPVKKIDQLFLRSNHSDESMMKQLIAHDALRSTGVYSPAGRFVFFYKKGKLHEIRHLQERPEGGFMEAQTGLDKTNFEAYAGNIHSGLYAKINAGWETSQQVINIKSFSNFLLNQWIAKVQDFAHYRNYRAAGPIDLDSTNGNDLAWHFFNWDMDLGFKGRTSYSPYTSPRNILDRLRKHTAFRLQFADRINCTMENEGAFTAATYLERVFKRSEELDLFIAHHNPTNINTNRFLNQISAFLPERVEWLKKDMEEKGYYSKLKPLSYSLEEGEVASDQQLTLTNPNSTGTIYYTLDGSDIRTEEGALTTEAILYQGPITLDRGVYEIFARVYNPSAEDILDRWSAACGAKTFTVVQPCGQTANQIIINEINYNSNKEQRDAGDWIELYNPKTETIDLSGWILADEDDTFLFPKDTYLEAGAYSVLVANKADFTGAFPNVNSSSILGELPFKLNNKGEEITLYDMDNCLVDQVIYDDKSPWSEAADGEGPSLSLLDPTLDNALPASWSSSIEINAAFPNGSPGASNQCAPDDPCAPTATCNGIDPQLIGTPCDDGDECTTGERFDTDCNCTGGNIADRDEDGICDALDTCDNRTDDSCTQEEDIYERCGYRFLHTAATLTIFDAEDAYMLINNLTTDQSILYCDDWTEQPCADSLMIELETGNHYEIIILNLESRCEAQDTIIN